MKIGTRILMAFITLVVSFAIVLFIGFQNQERVAKTKWWVEHTYIVLAKLDAIFGQISKNESNVRAYVIMSDDKLIRGWMPFQTTLLRDLDELQELTKDNPNQQARLNELKPLINDRISGLQKTIDDRKSKGKDARVLLSYEQMEISKKIADTLQTMKQEELSLLQKRNDEISKLVHESEQVMAAVIIMTLILAASGVTIVIKSISRGVNNLMNGADKIGRGDLEHTIEVSGQDELSKVAQSFNSMANQLTEAHRIQTDKNWMKTQLNDISLALQGIRDPQEAGILLLEHLCKATNAQWGVAYGCGLGGSDAYSLQEIPTQLELIGTYACSTEDGIETTIEFGEGILGQCGVDLKMHVLSEVLSSSIKIKTATTSTKPAEIVVFPAVFEDKLKGVIELAKLSRFTPIQLELLEELSTQLGVIFHFIKGQVFTDNLLKEAQTLNEELQSQQEELESQQEELRQANEELEQKAEILDQQYQAINEKNRELEQLQTALEVRANELEMASKYKSEFLANMSHDLRTPLNSLLIFSELLMDNENEHLDEDELEYAKNIRLAGKALLTLIDDILDLSKIESGTITLDLTEIPMDMLVKSVRRNFEKDANRKKLDFNIEVSQDTPSVINTDQKRILQLLNNLLANAFKFTETGSVNLAIKKFDPNGSLISFEVQDTGIGIDPSKHQMVFEAFQQAESTTKTRYGGTGLGLAICRKLAETMGGTIQLSSALGQGSTFTVILPVNYNERGQAPMNLPNKPLLRTSKVEASKYENKLDSMMETDMEDDRFQISAGDKVLLIIEDDRSFANMLLSVARKQGFKGVVTLNGMDGLELARKILPDGITLDLRLPDTDGWVVLDQLKNSSETRHIPVHVISIDNQEHRSLSLGAAGFLEKPVTLETLSDAMVKIRAIIDRTTQTILFVEPDEPLRKSLSETLEGENLNIVVVDNADAAMEEVRKTKFDCAIIDLNLKGGDGLTLVKELQKIAHDVYLPMIIYSSSELSQDQKDEMKELNKSGVIKDVHSPERLLNEAGLFLHRVERTLPETKRKLLKTFRQDENPFADTTMLIVDDDPRNITALKSVLQKYSINVLTAENGLQAIEKVESSPKIDLVLMDIMMPEMDGYEATRKLRSNEKFKKLPIIAVTAKAMKGDRQKCLEAGASDYITKPVDRGQLLSLLRVWLYKA
ncbi:MAG: response regulator [Candidatus Melainabacteria bacterium]|nr:response regulator [Candidatus Melainabacteria bacterium]